MDYEVVKGAKLEVLSQEQAEQVAVVACMPVGPTEFADNEHGTCADCGQAIMFRPTAPKGPRKVCMPCVLQLMRAEQAAGRANTVATTPQQVAELLRHTALRNAEPEGNA